MLVTSAPRFFTSALRTMQEYSSFEAKRLGVKSVWGQMSVHTPCRGKAHVSVTGGKLPDYLFKDRVDYHRPPIRGYDKRRKRSFEDSP